MTNDHAVASKAHDALWAVLWNRRYDDVDEPVWFSDSAYSGVVAFAFALDEAATVAGIDTGDSFVIFRVTGSAPPIGSRVRVLPGAPEQWRFADVQPLGLGVELRFDDTRPTTAGPPWIQRLRDGVQRVRRLLDANREHLAARRAQLGALSEPQAVEEVWREAIAAISDRVKLQTEYTPSEHAALAKARAKGSRCFDEEQARVLAARKRRFDELAGIEVARFREGAWPQMRDRAAGEVRRYADYRTEVVRLEDAMHRIRTHTDRATNAAHMLEQLERVDFRVRAIAFDPERLDDPAYAEELLRTVELLYAAIPSRAQSVATSFSAYRAPTAGPSVTPPRV
ncbi:MAG: hypothetical protein NVS3B10_18040 [Polyangiales bacterium]